jgi:ribosomal protein L6P/L9E
VRDAAMAIRRIRPPNVYTGNGIRLLNENVKLRQRAGSK